MPRNPNSPRKARAKAPASPEGYPSYRNRTKWGEEWLPPTAGGRVLMNFKRQPKPIATVYVQIMPAPNWTWQVCRIDLNKPVARGFRTKEEARQWIGRAMRQGVLPEGVVEIEPPETSPPDSGHSSPSGGETSAGPGDPQKDQGGTQTSG